MKKPKAVAPQVKFQAALVAVKGERSLVELARAYAVHPNTIVLSAWTISARSLR